MIEQIKILHNKLSHAKREQMLNAYAMHENLLSEDRCNEETLHVFMEDYSKIYKERRNFYAYEIVIRDIFLPLADTIRENGFLHAEEKAILIEDLVKIFREENIVYELALYNLILDARSHIHVNPALVTKLRGYTNPERVPVDLQLAALYSILEHGRELYTNTERHEVFISVTTEIEHIVSRRERKIKLTDIAHLADTIASTQKIDIEEHESRFPHIPKGKDQKTIMKRREYFSKYEHIEDFILYYFNIRDKNGNLPLAPLAEFHKDALDNLLSGRKPFQFWVWFRGSAKSALSTYFVPMWLLLNNKLNGYLLMSNTLQTAEALISNITKDIINNPLIRRDYGLVRRKGSISNNSFTLSTELRTHAVPFFVFGIEQNPQGVKHGLFRPNLIVLDDYDTLNYENPERRYKVFRVLKGLTLGTFGKEDKNITNYFISSNNLISNSGLVAEWLKELKKNAEMNNTMHQRTYCRIVSASEKDGKPCMIQHGGIPTWKYFTEADIQKKVDAQGKEALIHMYNMHVPRENSFDLSDITYVSPDELAEYQPERVVVYCDPAYTNNATACAVGIVALARYKIPYKSKLTNAIQYRTQSVLMDCFLDHTDAFYQIHLDMAYKYSQLFKSTKVICMTEANGQQLHLVQDYYTTLITSNHKYQLINFHYDTTQKDKKNTRILSLLNPIRNGHIVFLEQLLEKHEYFSVFLEQMESFPRGKNDGLDALYGAFYALETHVDPEVHNVEVNPPPGQEVIDM